VISQTEVLSVTQLNTYLKFKFEGDEILSNVFVTGEISNFTCNYRSGHLYFTLKDDRCAIRAVMFSKSASRLKFSPEDGMKVLVRGRVSIYEVSGQYQLYVQDMQPDGLGALSLAFEQLKSKLEKEGLFDQSRKKPIPRFPESIGVITSPTGAAVHDVMTILARRYPLAQVIFRPVQVQGDAAAPQIAAAIRQINQLKCADVIIVGRGGGSLEDLWPFNEEIVARAVAESEIPVISAVGHETDFTICDFAADLRAPTPSAAAELAVPDSAELLAGIETIRMNLIRAASEKVANAKAELSMLSQNRFLKNPLESIELKELEIDRLFGQLIESTRRSYEREKEHISTLCGKLNALSPLSVLSRGYAEVFNNNGKIVTGTAKISIQDKIAVRFSDGTLYCTVDEKKAEGENE
jgi:exodeoxyribonuclease VII large subunit